MTSPARLSKRLFSIGCVPQSRLQGPYFRVPNTPLYGNDEGDVAFLMSLLDFPTVFPPRPIKSLL